MRLSVLIPSVPSRFAMAEKLYNHLLSLVGDKEIEVLLLMDNKKRTIGEKREALKNVSRGHYFMFCDDDDWIESLDEVYEATGKHVVDVITFKARCKNKDGSDYIVTFGLGNEVEHKSDDNGNYLDIKRPPFHQCAWHHKFRKIEYPDINYGEDWVWVEQALEKAKREIHIDKVVHCYNFDENVTEASTESNEYWANPNEPSIPIQVVINYVTDEYLPGQQRLINSLLGRGDYCLFGLNKTNFEAPPHSENPYAFKIYAIEKARSMGYNQILWLDASVYAVKDISPVWNWLTEKGIFLEEAGHYAGSWCNDYTLKYFGITRQEAMKMPMFAAGYVGFDFRNPISVEFFARWKESMLNGCFKGSWFDHRHDMTCGSIIANQMGLLPLYSPGGQFFAYVGKQFGEPKETAVFHLQGL